jgi:hypothetical protein
LCLPSPDLLRLFVLFSTLFVFFFSVSSFSSNFLPECFCPAPQEREREREREI